jgi:hypothetical protein
LAKPINDQPPACHSGARAPIGLRGYLAQNFTELPIWLPCDARDAHCGAGRRWGKSLVAPVTRTALVSDVTLSTIIRTSSKNPQQPATGSPEATVKLLGDSKSGAPSRSMVAKSASEKNGMQPAGTSTGCDSVICYGAGSNQPNQTANANGGTVIAPKASSTADTIPSIPKNATVGTTYTYSSSNCPSGSCTATFQGQLPPGTVLDNSTGRTTCNGCAPGIYAVDPYHFAFVYPTAPSNPTVPSPVVVTPTTVAVQPPSSPSGFAIGHGSCDYCSDITVARTNDPPASVLQNVGSAISNALGAALVGQPAEAETREPNDPNYMPTDFAKGFTSWLGKKTGDLPQKAAEAYDNATDTVKQWNQPSNNQPVDGSSTSSAAPKAAAPNPDSSPDVSSSPLPMASATTSTSASSHDSSQSDFVQPVAVMNDGTGTSTVIAIHDGSSVPNQYGGKDTYFQKDGQWFVSRSGVNPGLSDDTVVEPVKFYADPKTGFYVQGQKTKTTWNVPSK